MSTFGGPEGGTGGREKVLLDGQADGLAIRDHLAALYDEDTSQQAEIDALEAVAIPAFVTGAATAGAATANGRAGKITSEALTTAQNGIWTLTLTNSAIAAADAVFASVANGTNTQGTPTIGRVQPAAGSVVIQVINQHATAEAFNGTVVVSFWVLKPAA